MTTRYDEYVNAMDKLGSCIIQLGRLDDSVLAVSNDNGDQEYQSGWNEIKARVVNFADRYDEQRNEYRDFEDASVGRIINAEFWANDRKAGLLTVKYFDTGRLHVLSRYHHHPDVVYYRPDNTLCSKVLPDETIKPIEIGRKVASAELAYLSAAIQSPAATLDYWQTEPPDNWYQQSHWADIRGVGRQTINDRIRDANESLQGNE